MSKVIISKRRHFFKAITWNLLAMATTFFILSSLPPYFGFEGAIVDISIGTIAESVAIYLGIPFVLGIFSRLILVKLKGEEWYMKKFTNLSKDSYDSFICNFSFNIISF